MTALALSFQETQFSVVDRNGQVWLKAPELAQALGYANSDAVGKLYSRNSDEFTESMTQVIDIPVTPSLTVSKNLQNKSRIFSLRGAHLIAMFARTAVAKEFRRWVLDILDREVLSQAINKRIAITPEQKDELREIADNRLVGYTGKQARSEIWGRHNRHFNINSYHELLAIRFEDSKQYLRTIELRTKPNFKSAQPVVTQPTQPAQPHPIIQDVQSLCLNMLWVYSWWQKFGDGVRVLNPNIANAVHDRFVFGHTEANMLLRQMERAGSAKAIYGYPWHESVEVRNSYWLRHGK